PASVLTYFFFSSRRRHTRFSRDWSSDVCSSDLDIVPKRAALRAAQHALDRRPIACKGARFEVFALEPSGPGQYLRRAPHAETARLSVRRIRQPHRMREPTAGRQNDGLACVLGERKGELQDERDA